jgi:hypothetical protein
VLRDHIVKGYTVNEQRLMEESAKLLEMRQTVALLPRTLANQESASETGRDVLRVIGDYAYARPCWIVTIKAHCPSKKLPERHCTSLTTTKQSALSPP